MHEMDLGWLGLTGRGEDVDEGRGEDVDEYLGTIERVKVKLWSLNRRALSPSMQ